jgi:hypothetical protein
MAWGAENPISLYDMPKVLRASTSFGRGCVPTARRLGGSRAHLRRMPRPGASAIGVGHHNAAEARRAPSTKECSLAQAILESTLRPQAEVPKPQSVPAMTRSRPTTSA